MTKTIIILKKKGYSLLFIIFLLLIFLLSSCHHHREGESNYNHVFQQTLNNPDKYEIIKGGVTGTTYGWKFLFINVVGLSYSDAIHNLWKNSGISTNEREGCSLINIRTYKGIDWDVILTGQTYLTVIADIIRLKNFKAIVNNGINPKVDK